MSEDSPAAGSQPSPQRNLLALTWTSELRASLAFAAGVLVLVRCGQWLPMPGFDLAQLAPLLKGQGPVLFGLIIRPPSLSSISIFALGLWPFVYAWIVCELLRGSAPSHTVAVYRRWLTLAIACLMAAQIVYGIYAIPQLVRIPPTLFAIMTVPTLVAGTMLLMWLGEQITKTGLCDGIWLIVAAGFIADVPRAVLTLWQWVNWGMLAFSGLVLLAVLVLTVVVLIVVMESAKLKVATQRTADDGTQRGGDLMLRIDHATILPAIMAGMLLVGVGAVIALFRAQIGDVAHLLAAHLDRGQPFFLLISAVLIVMLTFVVTARLVSPQAIAARLSADGRSLADVAPEQTAAYLDKVLTRTTILTAAYLLVISMLPEVMYLLFNLPFSLGGPTTMIVVIVMLDILNRARAESRPGR